MFQIKNFEVDGRSSPIGLSCDKPVFSWELISDRTNTVQTAYHITVCYGSGTVWDSGNTESDRSLYIPYAGEPLSPHTEYRCRVSVADNHGEIASAKSTFFTGKLAEPWSAKWITSGSKNPEDNALPVEVFSKQLEVKSKAVRAVLYASALGIYEAELNGQKIGDEFFAPGYTDYKACIQFQAYDVTALLASGENTLRISLANGWYCGTIVKRNNFYGDERALIAELVIEYAGGTRVVTATDGSWHVTDDGALRYTDFYNGEVTDNSHLNEGDWHWRNAKIYTGKRPELVPHFGAHVKKICELVPVSTYQDKNGSVVYDLGQNFSGVVNLTAKAKKGTVITIRHAEITDNDGCLSTDNLRGAKAQLTLTCGRDGEQTFEPKFTFMGFRYVEVSSSEPVEIVKLIGVVLSSDTAGTAAFSCSDALVNRLWQNIIWGQRSNFLEIPTDCPQRNERIGWTGDIAVFASTAAYNADISLFMRKWLHDLRTEQSRSGLLPFTVPDTHGFTPFKLATAGWGDAAILVPWAVHLAYGDKQQLAQQYDSMKKWLAAEKRAAAFCSFGHKRYIWNFGFQFGDWCAPNESVRQWMKKGKWLATAYYANSARIMGHAAEALGYDSDAVAYVKLFENIKAAFCREFLLDDGRLTGDFQSAYVCALVFDLLPRDMRERSAARLQELLKQNDGCLATGFLGTPYLTFALSDSGYEKEAYDLLLNTKCPGWLYTVKAGGTTIWERWDGLDENGKLRADIGISNMISFNHYAYGAVGDWFYRRICGLETNYKNPGYKHFTVKPIPDSRFSFAETVHHSSYGDIAVRWELAGEEFRLSVAVPVNTTADIVLPNGEAYTVGSGQHEWTCKYTI